jgi:hypothetical protein
MRMFLVMQRPSQRCHFHARGAASVVLTACVCLLLLGSTASATPAPHVSWMLPSSATADSPVSFTWTASHLAPHSQLVVQRQEGTARSWRTVARLTGASGSASLPGLPMGSYRLRLAVLGSRHLVRGYQQRLLEAFGEVPFSSLFPGHGHPVYAAATSSFPYVSFAYGVNNTDGVLTDSQNNCRSVHLEFVPGTVGSFSSEMVGQLGTMTLVQESQDPASVTVPFNTVGTLDANVVVGQSWSVNFSQTGEYLFTFYVNGSASCDSAVAVS